MLHEDALLRFYLIRHGESNGNIKSNLIMGRNENAHLSQRGFDQAKALGKRFDNEDIQFDHFYSSSLSRAIETAETINKNMKTPANEINHIGELCEYSAGDWEGRSRQDVYTSELKEFINSKGSLFIPPGGESQRMVERRASNWLEDQILYNSEIVNSGMPLNIGIVAHSIVIKCLIHYIMGFNDRLIWRIRLDNCSVSRFIFKKEGWFPVSINDSYHINDLK